LAIIGKQVRDLVAGVAAPTTKHLVTVYFDTPDLALARCGVSVRLRKAGRQYSQSVKARHQPGIVSRREWEWPCAGNALDVARLGEGEVGTIIPPDAIMRLRPIFRTEVTRTTYRIQMAGCDIELALDRGAIIAGDAETPLCELELELKSGAARGGGLASLYQVALTLHRAAPLMIGTQSKADRGYALIEPQSRLATHADPIDLPASTTLGDGLSAILGDCLRQVVANQAAAAAGDVEGVHQMRVGVRRLRGAFQLFRHRLGDEDLRFRDDLKFLSDALGAARDWDVFVTLTLDLVKPQAGPDFHRIVEATRSRQTLVHDELTGAIRSPRYTDLMLRLGGWIEAAGWTAAADGNGRHGLTQPVSTAAGPLLARLAKKTAKAGRGIARFDDVERHGLRNSVKTLRDGVAFLGSLHDQSAVKAYRLPLSELQDILGDLNDLVVGRRFLTDLRQAGAQHLEVDDLIADLKTRSGNLLDRLPKAWHRFAKAEPFWD
jgi:inorganic triphosphatase YgiF